MLLMGETKIKFLKLRRSHLVNALHSDDHVFLSQSFVGECPGSLAF